MPKNHYSRPRRADERLLLFVAFPSMCILDLTGPQTVFNCASRAMSDMGRPGYRCETVSHQGGLVRSCEGVTVQTRSVAEFSRASIDTVMIPGTFDVESILNSPPGLLQWIRRTADKARRMTSVCNGAFMLAEAGLLSGRRAATHWITCDLLQRRFPDVEVDADAIFVKQGSIWTSAGVSTCIDMSLALVEEDCGRNVALGVARELVVYSKRSGGQAQYSEMLRSQTLGEERFDELHRWIQEHIHRKDITVELLADQARMSVRNFSRLFKQHTGQTPARSIEAFRLEAVQRLLEDSQMPIKQIAHRCGFGNEARMRSAFTRRFSVSPLDYRRRFASTLLDQAKRSSRAGNGR